MQKVFVDYGAEPKNGRSTVEFKLSHRRRMPRPNDEIELKTKGR